MNLLASEVDSGMGVFRENFFKQLDLFRGDVQLVFQNMARDTTLKTLPWVALGGVVLVGTPLLTLYLYKKGVHNLGRPQLAQEVRKVGIWDRTTDGVSRIVSSIWNSTKTGVKWSTLAGAAGVSLATVGAITSGITTGNSGLGGEVLNGLFCAIDGGRGACNHMPALPLISTTIGVGVLRASADAANSFYNFAKKSMKKDAQPVFNDELQKRIDDLTTSTYNINRNGGYMQNLLLYGPGGTGKTMVSKYIAKNSKMNYVMMSGGDLAQYIKRGEHVTELNKLFADARNSHSPTIVFIDECESLCGDRGKMDRSELIELVNSFLNQTGEPSKKIMVILTTNRKDDLDPAVLSRMDHKLYIGLPEQAERKKIIELYLPTFMTSLERKELLTVEVITSIAKQTEGFTGRTIFKMLNAISGMRAATNSNKLTEKMITDTVSAFVKQEADIAGISPPLSAKIPPKSILSNIPSIELEQPESVIEKAMEVQMATTSGDTPTIKLEKSDVVIKNTEESQRIDVASVFQAPLKALNVQEPIQAFPSLSAQKTSEFKPATSFRQIIENIYLWWKNFSFKNFLERLFTIKTS
jgi:hypothetical protein